MNNEELYMEKWQLCFTVELQIINVKRIKHLENVSLCSPTVIIIVDAPANGHYKHWAKVWEQRDLHSLSV